MAVAISEIIHRMIAIIVLNVGVNCFELLLHKKLPVIKQESVEDGRASVSASYVKFFLGGNSPVEASFAKIMDQDKLIMALNDSGSSVNLVSLS